MSGINETGSPSIDTGVVGFEEEGEIVIKVEKVVYIENIKDYNDERISNEVRDLVKLDFQTFFGRMHFYNQYLINIVKALRTAIDARFKTGDESLYTPIQHRIHPLIQVDPVRIVDKADEEGGTQVLTDYLLKRHLLFTNNDSPTIIEARAIKHMRPFTTTLDADSKWLVVLPTDSDCLAVNEDNKVVRSVRTMTRTMLHTEATPHVVDAGDKVPFKGFMYFGRVDGERQLSASFNLDEYIENVHGFRVGQRVLVMFNIGLVVDSHTVTSVNGVVRHVDGHLARIEVDSENNTIIDFCMSDLTVNNCFVYGPKFNGEKYSKRALFNQNWRFLLDEEPMSPGTLASIVFPTVSEGIDIFPELSHITSFAMAEQILGGEYQGRDNHAAVTAAIGNTIRDIRKREKKKVVANVLNKRGTRFSLSPGLDMLHFQKNAKILSKYFAPYALVDSFVDGDQSRFEHVSRNPHLLYAYCLDLLRKHFTPVTKPVAKANSKHLEDAVKDMDIPDGEIVFTSARELFSSKAEDGDVAVLQAPGRVPTIYKMNKGRWMNQSRTTMRYTNSAFVLPGGTQAVDFDEMDANTINTVASKVAERIKHVRENESKLTEQLAFDIVVHASLGKYKEAGRRFREICYSEDVDYAAMLGNGEEPDVDELLNNQEAFGDMYAPIAEEELAPTYDFDLGQMLQEPIGVVFALFIEMFGINMDGDELKIMLYNVSKYHDFDELKSRLRDKERALKAQVQQMRNKNVPFEKSAVDGLIKQRLMAEEKAFMAEYYGQVVAMACAFMILYVQSSLPAVKMRPLAAASMCNKQFSYTGFPLDEGDTPKSLVKYLACVVGTMAPTSGKDTPLHMAHTYIKTHDLGGLIRGHIDTVLETKPHYRARINAARKRMADRLRSATDSSIVSSRTFYGFRPSPGSVRERFPDINLDDMLMYRATDGSSGQRVNACCMQEIDSLKTREAGREHHAVLHGTFKVVRPERDQPFINDAILTETIEMPDVRILNEEASLGKRGASVAAFMEANAMFVNDRYLADIAAIGEETGSDDEWNALSAHVKMHWHLLAQAIKASKTQQELWFEVFVIQEDRYRNPSEVKTVFEKVTCNTIPAILGRAVNDYLVDTRHIDKKTHILAEHRNIIKMALLDRESEFLITLMQQDDDGVLRQPMERIVSGSFAEASQLGSQNTHMHRTILLYNYVILKVCYMLMHASVGDVPDGDMVFDKSQFEMLYMTSPRVRAMAEFVRMLIDKVCRILETNHVDTDKIRTEFERQREHVKQDLMRKMEKFSREERAAFRVLKEKTGIGSEYLDQIQMQAAALIEMMNRPGQEAEANVDPAPQDLEDIPMEWVGEDPDDIELEDDGSGY